jgi:hypothetical protein
MRARWIFAVSGLLIAGLVTLFVLFDATHQAPNSIERLSAYQNEDLMRVAWALPVARRYGPAGYTFQRNPSVCGPTSIADLLHSEGKQTTPEQVLKGAGIETYFGLLPNGMTLDQEAAVLRLRTGQPVTVLRGLSLAAFRKEIARSNDVSRRYIVNFSREPLFGRGHGHFSPVLGYLAKQDLVFVGDVNDHYRPWLVPTARLYAAQDGVDSSSHAKRGLLWVSAR